MAKTDTATAEDAARTADAKSKDPAPAPATLAADPVTTDGSRANVDPESDLGKAIAADKSGTSAYDLTGNAADGSGAGTDESVAEKITVETTGDFMLHDPYTLETIQAKGTSTVTKSAFTDDKLASGQLKEA